jgi:hypothetical protein
MKSFMCRRFALYIQVVIPEGRREITVGIVWAA